MSTEQQLLHPDNDSLKLPPTMATALLSFFLPASLREPVLGDLAEEYLLRCDTASGAIAVHRWYWWQVLKSSCQFIWQQRGTGMAYFLSAVFFLFMLVLALVTQRYGIWYVSPPTLIALLPSALALGIGATSFEAAKRAMKLSFSDAGEQAPGDVLLARKFLHVTGNQFLLVAAVVFFLGSINLLISLSQSPDLLTDPMRYARFAVALLPLLYGMIFKCLFYSAEQKVIWKYAQS